MTHEVDRLGYPKDPHLRKLEFHLGDLAGEWGGVARGIEKQDEIVREYLETLQEMYELGWRGNLDIEAELTYDLMPEWYLNQ